MNLSRLFPRVGIDLGTRHLRVWQGAAGLVMDEPACVAFDTTSKQVIAVGVEAAAMEGRVGEHIRVEWPMRSGELADATVAQALLRVSLQKTKSVSPLVQPVIMASVPALSSQAARQALVQSLYGVGARSVYTIAQPLAASIGAGVPIADASGSFFLQLGSGVVEGAVVSLGSMVATESNLYGGDFLSKRIRSKLKADLQLQVSSETIERLKHEVLTVRQGEHKRMLVTGQDIARRSPKEIEVSSSLLQPVAEQFLRRHEQLLRRLLSKIPPELTVDVIDKGLLLSGGLAHLEGMDNHFVHALGIPTSVVEEPQHAVIRGIGTALDHLELFTESLGYFTDHS